jgi:hypothetical protein
MRSHPGRNTYRTRGAVSAGLNTCRGHCAEPYLPLLLVTHLRTGSLSDLRQWLALERLVRPGVEDQRRQPGPVLYSNDLTQHDQMIACAV